MNTNETQLINSMLALAALSANISPEELKEYVNVLSLTPSRSGVTTGSVMWTSFAVPLDCFACTVTRPAHHWLLLPSVCWKIA